MVCSALEINWVVHKFDVLLYIEFFYLLLEQVRQEEGSFVLFGIQPDVEKKEDELDGLAEWIEGYYVRKGSQH